MAANGVALAFAFVASTALLGLACVEETAMPLCDQGKCDDAPLASPCASALVDRSGRGALPAALADDLLTGAIYMDEALGCPTDFARIVAALREANDCKMTVMTRAVSESAARYGRAGASYRTVSNVACGDNRGSGLFLALFGFSDTDDGRALGLHPEGTALPGGVEIMAFDRSRGVYNYYKEVDGVMGFFGSSLDFVTEGPGGPAVTSVRGCANCHVGGGPIMKELQSPWLHWTGTRTTPGHRELVAARPAFGVESNGAQLEGLARQGMIDWTGRRVEHLRQHGTVAQLLAPLFCPVEVNVGSGSTTTLPLEMVVDDRAGTSNRPILLDGYAQILDAVGSTVDGGDARDTDLPMAHIVRSGADQHYVDELVRRGIVDKDFERDVLMVDFTRPALSDDRCDLLALAPELPPGQREAAAIRAGFLAQVEGAAAGTPAAELRANLAARAAGQPRDYQGVIARFVTACRARKETIAGGAGAPLSAFTADVVKLRSLARKAVFADADMCTAHGLAAAECADDLDGSAAHARAVFEFQATMPFDRVRVAADARPDELDRVAPGARLDPNDCRLVTEFVPIR
jgi:hypothetical protein